MLNQVCPKCNGQLYIENDVTGLEEVCLQCGWRRELSKPKNLILRPNMQGMKVEQEVQSVRL
jgi:Zn ribbon nucleic-acid-binding protein